MVPLMSAAPERPSAWDGFWLLACILASSVWCVTAAGRLGPTFDEPVYIEQGLHFWRTGSHAGLMKLGTMPLPVDWATLPLALAERWRGVPWDPDVDMERILPWARGAALAFWWLLLLYAMRIGRRLGGPWAGRLAVCLLACEPTLVAHAGLATTDVALTGCLLAFVYHFQAAREGGAAVGRWRGVGLPSLWFAAAVLAKASGLFFGVLCMGAIEAERLVRTGALQCTPAFETYAAPRMLRRLHVAWLALRPFRRHALQVTGLGTLLVFAYCGSDGRPQPSFVAWARQLPDGGTARGLVWLAEHLRIFSNAGEGLVRQIVHNYRGHGVYLLGQTARRALWYYFPVALTIKLSVPALLLPVAVAAVRPRALANWACVCAAALLGFSLGCRVQIGIRLVLPLVALGLVGVAAAAVNAARARPGVASRILPAILTAGILATATAAAAVWPHGLCFTNRLWGGTSRGYLYLSDSNYDWGQGLKDLERWRARRGLSNLAVWYQGTDPARSNPALHETRLHEMPIAGPEDVVARVRGRFLAASTTLLYGAYGNTPAHQISAEFLRRQRPVARTQTYLIYDFTRVP